ncbi:hypothetical protein FGW20_11330 [Methanoculleus sp. FWC-SCC3]|uniref:Uncharacterized protein n=1 Tax=Methanoculleus methanifontis TaxID=2584086 RepID=A0ABT8M4U2_9EURY|nr:hypothetical protein [Methanoculleus sp. FWC-SCC3]MDN7013614.1 hypothetical protein [Methanoculleus sp. FWC-SCC3]
MDDLEKRVLEDLKAAVRREDDLEPAEDAVGDADEVPVNGGERQDLVCRGDVRLVDLDFQDRRRIGALLCKTMGDPDLRGDSSPVLADILPENNIVLCRGKGGVHCGRSSPLHPKNCGDAYFPK